MSDIQELGEKILGYYSNPWVGLIITLLTIILTIIGLYASFRKKRNLIVHTFQFFYEVGKGLNIIFPDFNLTYKGKTINNYVMVIRGYFRNDGDDINIKKPNNIITIKLPPHCNILDKRIKTSHEKLVIKTAIKDRSVNDASNSKQIRTRCNNTIDFYIEDGLMKNKEYFKYAIILETPNDITNIDENISIDHRITNTDILKNSVVSKLLTIYRLMGVLTMALGIFVLLIGSNTSNTVLSLLLIALSTMLFILTYTKSAEKSLSRIQRILIDIVSSHTK